MCVNPIWGGTKTGVHIYYGELKDEVSHQDGTLPLAAEKEEFIFNLTFNLQSGFENQTGSGFSLRSNMSDCFCFFFTTMYF